MEGYCRGCLKKHGEPTDLWQYSERNRRLFVYSTGLQVKRNDTCTFQLCRDCYYNMKLSCRFKKLCRSSDKKLKNYFLLKDNGDNADLSSYLKNVDDSIALRLPLASGHSTPAHHKKDDDNESTCTSIGNFMTDILEGEEDIPPTEARIIRELIEEEADILDDSLDSHWLHDDTSIDTDFKVDFDFSPFSTSRSINNDRCYTPKKLNNGKNQEINYYNPKKNIERCDETEVGLQNDMPVIDDYDMGFDNAVDSNLAIQDVQDVCKNVDATENDQIEILKDINISGEIQNTNNLVPKQVTQKCVENNTHTKLDSLNDVLHPEISHDVASQEFMVSNEKDFRLALNQGKAQEVIELSPLRNELEYYINKAKLKKKNSLELEQIKQKGSEVSYKSSAQDTIDKNLELALKNKDNKELFLDQLLISSQVNVNSGASTPTIRNILFGDTPNINISPTLEQVTKNIQGESHSEYILKNEKQTSKQKSELNKELLEEERRPGKGFIKFEIKPKKESLKHKRKFKPVKGKDIKTLEKLLKVSSETESTKNDNLFKDDKSVEQNQDTNGHNDLLIDEKSELEENKVTDIKTEITEIENDQLEQINGVEENTNLFRLETSENEFIKDKIINIELENTNGENITNNEGAEIEDNDSFQFEVDYDNLFNSDDEMEDLNFSIPSDFLQAIEKPDVQKDEDDLFKRPFSPLDDKYDLNENFCRICKKKFTSSKNLRIHFFKSHKYKIHNPEKGNRAHMAKAKTLCDLCGEEFNDAGNFHRHVKKHAEKPIKPCPFCTLVFPTKGRLDKHVRMHTGEGAKKVNKDNKKFECEVCGKYSSSLSNLRTHQKRHTQNYKFSCDVCFKGFFRAGDYEYHMRIHSGDRPFKCSYCPQAYKRRYLLIRHVLNHVDQFKCELCGANFVSQSLLDQHLENVCKEKVKINNGGQNTETNTNTDGSSNEHIANKEALGGNRESIQIKTEPMENTTETGAQNHTKSSKDVDMETIDFWTDIEMKNHEKSTEDKKERAKNNIEAFPEPTSPSVICDDID